MDPLDAIGLMLAARRDPAIRDLADYQKAEALVDGDPALRGMLDGETAFYDGHEDLLSGVRLPDEAKARMKDALRAEVAGAGAPAGQTISFPIPWLRLAAAAGIAILVGLAATRFAGTGGGPGVAATSVDPFSRFAVKTVADGFDLVYLADSTPEIVRWFAGRDAPVTVYLDPAFMDLSTMGCTVLDWNGTDVAMICFKSGEDIVHLFVTEQRAGTGVVAQSTRTVEGRETRSWADEGRAYVLVAHNAGQKLKDFPG